MSDDSQPSLPLRKREARIRQGQASVRQREAERCLKALRAAGYSRGRFIAHPDGRVELIGEDGPDKSALPPLPMSPFEKWKSGG